ncbi:hypothetical protein [Candidatus Cardinium hertigii]|uniref:Uncharacterized protein n=1 Tax=Candidatus Cardinium hertigii TaxID=247481 RepID=A0A3N2QB01_9BACT|nr:hypothetical protein [Candidatus Cardinium hertigii]ROT46965.1 hypothetical protein EDM02_05310 [Candidatus Cardinium hertigii]ROT47034.1 hypothetical protein EDM02_05740 [Candidatus Cardinium hertigii]
MDSLKDTPTSTSALSNPDTEPDNKPNNKNEIEEIIKDFKQLSLTDCKNLFNQIGSFTLEDRNNLEEMYKEIQLSGYLLQHLNDGGLLNPGNFRKVVNLMEGFPNERYDRYTFSLIFARICQAGLLTQQNLDQLVDTISYVSQQNNLEGLLAAALAFKKLYAKKLLTHDNFNKAISYKTVFSDLMNLLNQLDAINYLNQELLTSLLADEKSWDFLCITEQRYYYKLARVVENFHVKNPDLLATPQVNGREGLFFCKDLVVGLFPILGKSAIVNVLTLDSLELLIKHARWLDNGGRAYDIYKQWADSALKELEVALNLDLLTAYTFPLLMKFTMRSFTSGSLSSRSNFLKQLKDQNLLTQDNFQLLLTPKRTSFFATKYRLESMELLFEAGLLTQNNLQVLLSHKEAEEVKITLQVLTELDLLTQGMFQVIMESKLGEVIQNPQVEMLQLNLNVLDLNDAMEQSSKVLFKDIITQLNTANLFTAANFKLLFASKLSMRAIINGIQELKSANMFTENHLQSLLK